MFRYVVAITSLAILSGCSYIYGDEGIIRNRDTTYLSAKSIPELDIPPGLSSSTIQAHYPVADLHYVEGANKLNLTPPELVKPQPTVAQQSAPAAQSSSATQQTENKTSGSKQRYLSDIFQHPDYLMDSFVPNRKHTESANNSNTSSSNDTATTTNPSAQSATQSSAPKKQRYISDYFH